MSYLLFLVPPQKKIKINIYIQDQFQKTLKCAISEYLRHERKLVTEQLNLYVKLWEIIYRFYLALRRQVASQGTPPYLGSTFLYECQTALICTQDATIFVHPFL